MMLVKYCTQYASKFWPLSRGHRTGKGKLSFQSQKVQCQRMFKVSYNCAHFTCKQGMLRILQAMLQKYCTQYASKFGKLSSGHNWKMLVFIPITKKGNAKEWSNYRTIALISHSSKVMLKILQARLQQYVNHQFPDVQKKRQKNQRSNCQHPLDHRKIKRVPEKHLLLLYWLHQSFWLCGSQQTVGNFSRDGNTRPPDLPPEKSVYRTRSNC